MTDQYEDLYQCVGVCMSDPDSGVCMGCGRPPLGGPDVTIEIVPASREVQKPAGDPDTPE
jgi:hypothetical protein